MLIDSIQNGIVIDHITAGKAMELYQILGLDKLACTVAILKNVTSGKLGRKDIIKIDGEMELDWDLIGYVDPSITVNIIRGGELQEKRTLKLPERIRGVLRCQESALHHLDRARAAAGVRAHGSGAARLPLPVLRDRGGKMIPPQI